MFSIDQNKENIFHEAFLNHFKENKVEMTNATTKLFPFPESLRDCSFTTEKTYNVSEVYYISHGTKPHINLCLVFWLQSVVYH